MKRHEPQCLFADLVLCCTQCSLNISNAWCDTRPSSFLLWQFSAADSLVNNLQERCNKAVRCWCNIQCFSSGRLLDFGAKVGGGKKKKKLEAEPYVIKLLGHSRNKRCVNHDSANPSSAEHDSATPTQGADPRWACPADNCSLSSVSNPGLSRWLKSHLWSPAFVADRVLPATAADLFPHSPISALLYTDFLVLMTPTAHRLLSANAFWHLRLIMGKQTQVLRKSRCVCMPCEDK